MDDDDAQLKLAIQLSLQEAGANQLVIDLTTDDEEDTSPTKSLKTETKTSTQSSESKLITEALPAQSTFSILQLNRKQMEAERLARLKRDRPISPPPLRNPAKRSKSEDPKATVLKNIPQASKPLLATSGDSDPPRLVGIQYPKGVLKKTWAYGCPREGNDIKIEEVLQKSTLRFAYLSSFDWDVEWVLGKLMNKGDWPQLIFVREAKDTARRQACHDQLSEFPGIKQIFPYLLPGISCMHSKLQLLFHPTYLRIAIPSANLRGHDWGEDGGILENSVFLIDLPKLPNGATSDLSDLPFFGKELVRFLKGQKLDDSFIRDLLKFDFTETGSYAFIHNMGGAHTGDKWQTTGYTGLSTAVRELGLACPGYPEVDFVASSIGTLNIPYMKLIYNSIRGIDPLGEMTASAKSFFKKKDASVAEDAEVVDAIKKHFRFYFPSRQTVVASKLGIGGGGTNFLSRNAYTGAKFPRDLMRDCVSVRPKMLMHNKMILVRPPKPIFSTVLGYAVAAWAYHGSANFSESAWGRLSIDKQVGPKTTCRNWECGVLIPIPVKEETGQTLSGAVPAASATEYPDVDVFKPIVHVPFVVPSVPYEQRTPWYVREEL
jgi:hypothetical protein